MADFKRVFRLGDRGRSDARASVDEELQHHLQLCVDELVERGWSEDDAHREARRQFGDLERTKAYCEEMQTRRQTSERRTMSIDDSWQDLRYAARTLRKAPAYTALVVATLAFGIAANTTIFSVMNPYFFRSLPYEQPEELVHIGQTNPVTGWYNDRVSLPIYEDWRVRARAFEDLAAYTYGGANVTGPEGPEGLNAAYLTDNMFEVLGTGALHGRTFVSGEGGPASEPIVVLDHALWQRRYGGDPGVLGRAITVDGVQHTVIGVMPADFSFPFNSVRLWIPIRADAAVVDRATTPYLLVGRMQDGWTQERVDAELTAIQADLGSTYPDADGRWDGITVLHMREALNFGWDIMTVAFGILLGAVVFVLMIACVNVASLTLARSGARTREIAVRTAMGAKRSRVVRQLLTESVMLAVLSGALGVGAAYLAAKVIGPVLPDDLYRIGEVSVDGPVLAFSMLVTLATPLIFGLAPAVSATKRDLTEALKEGSRGSGGPGSTRGRRALVVAQVALAVVLITGAGLMMRSFMSVQALDIGFDAERALWVTVRPSETDYAAEDLPQYAERAVQELRALPGVTAASASLYVPLNHEVNARQFAPPAQSGTPAEEWPTAIVNRTYPDYFETLGIPLLAGRDFAQTDNRGSTEVAIVSQALVARYMANDDPIGRTLLIGDPADPTPVTIVGVVGGVLHEGLDADASRPQLYLPALQGSFRRHFLLARTDGDPAALIGPVRETLMAIDPDLPLSISPLTRVVQENQLQWSFGSVLLMVFGVGALMLATLGIYGLISFAVAQREKELGVRIALGASAGQIRNIVVGDGLRLTALGLGVGFIAAFLLGQALTQALFNVSPVDPATFAGVLVLFASVATLASLIPARRASRTDPIAVLRSE